MNQLNQWQAGSKVARQIPFIGSLALFSFLALSLLTLPLEARTKAENKQKIHEMREKVEQDLKSRSQNERETVLANSLSVILGRGQTSQALSAELRMALQKTLTYKEREQSTNVGMRDLAIQIESVNRWIKATDRNKLEVKEQERFDAVKEHLPTFADALSLAARTSDGKSNAFQYLAKQLALIPDILVDMPADQVKAHAQVLQTAIQIYRERPEILGEDAFVLAMNKIHGREKALENLDKLLNCIRAN